MIVFNQLESNVRNYCRSFPTVFKKAQGSILEDENGCKYLDFFSGAGTLNYGHNNPKLKERLLDYINADGLVHSLDMATVAKKEFLIAFAEIILKPRELDYKIQFCGPTGTNAIEAALKIARNTTGRHNVISFSNSFHGVTLGSLAATANAYYREASGIPTIGVTFMPYDGYLGSDVDTTEYLDKVLSDRSSGVDLPAAVILETVQGEGGVNVASFSWLRSLLKVCRKHHVLLIVDDVQAGCGRTGTFFSFEEAGISPDLVILSKSLSGFGLPFSVVLIKPELDQWKPGQHNGTFRGNNLAFVTAKAALEIYWQNDCFSASVKEKGTILRNRLEQIVKNNWEWDFSVRGRGMIQGLDCKDGDLASNIARKAFEKGLVIETCGSKGQVIKCLSPLTISEQELEQGLNILENCFTAAFRSAVAVTTMHTG
ncbi:diaminobutyrate--2-oxoglutarate transaminase [Plectonema radiosum NIES-515]|uniref:Diaminobutyrate--2-oxoglutarate transaminase n=1 Tax=Plectonema radiosum NIES-515 TaxID=2986073 RepID=A0ABT3AV78_9CYAN|nr:diaminobutyrate--2-oxoglutarate transaminase [Plectonema radiosum]MCV3213047.1 diaminobutyrate--2-oxoglutarate transaminase [Plectonema radiosum NIES-515]